MKYHRKNGLTQLTRATINDFCEKKKGFSAAF